MAGDWLDYGSLPGGLLGGLTRGQGAAAAHLREQPEQSALVYACLTGDLRWEGLAYDRHVYLAKLVRDLSLDLNPLADQLWAGPEPSDRRRRFGLTVGVLANVALAGNDQARDLLRDYVGKGSAWHYVLDYIDEPDGWRDELLSVAAARTDLEPPPPEDEDTYNEPTSTLNCLTPEADLVAVLLDPDADRDLKSNALRCIRRPVPEFVEAVEHIAGQAIPGMFDALSAQGQFIAAPARTWSTNPDHPLHQDSQYLLAGHGDERDIPYVVAAIDRRGDEWRGYDLLTEGLAGILARAGRRVHVEVRADLIRRLRHLLQVSPLPYERASYLRSLLQLTPDQPREWLTTYLLDCDSWVRELAISCTPLTGQARRWLAELAVDPLESDLVRERAAERLTPSSGPHRTD